jgi:hypothetical protein
MPVHDASSKHLLEGHALSQAGVTGPANTPACRRMTSNRLCSSSAGSAFASVGFVVAPAVRQDTYRRRDARHSPDERQELLHGPLKSSPGCHRTETR